MGDCMIRGRALSPGKATGKVVVCDQYVSPLGEIGKEGSISSGPCENTSITNKIFVFKGGRGSTVGSYVFLELKNKNVGPSGIINELGDQMVVTGAIISDIPMVDGIPTDIFHNEDEVGLDGSNGNVSIKDVEEKRTATVYLLNGEKVLLLKRSSKVSSFANQYSGVSGYMEGGEKPEETGKREVLEETGVRDVSLVIQGNEVYVRHGNTVFIITPMIMKTDSHSINLNWENSEFEWVDFGSLPEYNTVPKFSATFSSLLSRMRI